MSDYSGMSEAELEALKTEKYHAERAIRDEKFAIEAALEELRERRRIEAQLIGLAEQFPAVFKNAEVKGAIAAAFNESQAGNVGGGE